MVIVRVIDDTGSASLVLFDKMVHNLVDVSSAEIMTKPSELDMDGFPKQLNSMLGKKMLFKFVFSEYNINRNSHVYQVKAMSDDPDLIGFFNKDFVSEENDFVIETNQEPGNTSGSSGEKRAFVDLDKSEDDHDENDKGKNPMIDQKDKGKKPMFSDLDKE